jgi:putative DNA primase/helicase
MTNRAERRAVDAAARKSTTDPSRDLISRNDGLYRRLADGKKGPRIAERLRVVARARDARGKNWSRLIEFADADGVFRRILLPEPYLSDRGGQQLFSLLLGEGYDLPESKEDRAAIRDYLRTATERRAWIVRANGYVDEWAYLLGSDIIGASSSRYVLDPTIEVDIERYETHGTLADWQREIVDVVTGNRLCMLAIMAAFVGPLIKPLGLGDVGGGIQFYGESSQGKSGLLACAASVIGRPSNGAWVTWATTVNAIDDLALARSDSVLVIDETQSAGGQKSAAADVILPAIYRIDGGVEKARKRNGVGLRPVLGRWRLFAISSSEKSLPELAEAAGLELMKGCEVRFIDIAADAEQGLGVYERLPSGIDSSEQLTDQLKRNAEQYCGTAQRQFLERLLKDLNSAEDSVIGFLQDRKDIFHKRSGVTGFHGIEARIASRFGVIYAAGSLARKYKVLPWSRDAMIGACLWCYHRAIKRHATARAAVEAEVKNRIRDCWKQLRPRLATLDDGLDHPQAPGWLKTQRSGKEIILTAATFQQDLCGSLAQSKVIGILVDRKILVRNKEKKSTVQRTIPGIRAARGRRYYVLKAQALRDWLKQS